VSVELPGEDRASDPSSPLPTRNERERMLRLGTIIEDVCSNGLLQF